MANLSDLIVELMSFSSLMHVLALRTNRELVIELILFGLHKHASLAGQFKGFSQAALMVLM